VVFQAGLVESKYGRIGVWHDMILKRELGIGILRCVIPKDIFQLHYSTIVCGIVVGIVWSRRVTSTRAVICVVIALHH